MSNQDKILQDATLPVQDDNEPSPNDNSPDQVNPNPTKFVEIASSLANMGDELNARFARPTVEALDARYNENVVRHCLVMLFELYRFYWRHC